MIATLGFMPSHQNNNHPEYNLPEVDNVIFQRMLKDWCWELNDNKTVSLINRKNKSCITLDKVRLMSFMKFTVSALDKMRIEDNKKLRNQIRKTKKDYKQRIDMLRNKRKQQRNLFAKARKIK